MSTLSERLRLVMNHMGVTSPGELGKRIGQKTHSTISQYLSGTRGGEASRRGSVNVDILSKIADVADCDFTWLATGRGAPGFGGQWRRDALVDPSRARARVLDIATAAGYPKALLRQVRQRPVPPAEQDTETHWRAAIDDPLPALFRNEYDAVVAARADQNARQVSIDWTKTGDIQTAQSIRDTETLEHEGETAPARVQEVAQTGTNTGKSPSKSRTKNARRTNG